MGRTVWTQAGYADSQSGAFSLSKAASVVIPEQPPIARPRWLMFRAGGLNNSTIGFDPVWLKNPVVNYSTK